MVKQHPRITEDDLNKLLNAPVNNHPSQRDKFNTVLMLLWATGARISEITNLKKSDFDPEQKEITFFNTKNKSDRTVPITDEMVKRLKKLTYRKPQDSSMFNMRRIAAHRSLKRRLIASGITKDIRSHSFRHSFITRKIDEGYPLFNVQRFVGHKSASTTGLYYHHTKQGLREMIAN